MFILASRSPRRIKMIKEWNVPFKIEPADIDENAFSYQEVSYQKAIKIANIYPFDTIIAADTVVIFNNQIIGKPKDENDAFTILKKLSNNTHEVTTSFTIINRKKNYIYSDSVTSYVTFNDLDDELIWKYIATKSPLDKAGAYGIQDNDDFPLIKELKGSLDNVIGFPNQEIYGLLKKDNLLD